MTILPDFAAADFDYPLPEEQIAQEPLARRDASRLLLWKNGILGESRFDRIADHIPEGSRVVFNDSKVIRARLIFARETGATIEIFCLEPAGEGKDMESAFHRTGDAEWVCLVGNAKRWKDGRLVKRIAFEDQPVFLTAEKTGILPDGCFRIRFSWEPGHLSFSEVLERAGLVPLPPYIARSARSDDATRYQTVYAEHEGSVAAPTAGLHFTDTVLADLRNKNCLLEKVTLHIGLGTFRPVSAPRIADHSMHEESFLVNREFLDSLITGRERPLIAVGTTTVRTLESIYWMGVRLLAGPEETPGFVGQWDPYRDELPKDIPLEESLSALSAYLREHRLESLAGSTKIIIVPGYSFRLVQGLVTNFHMPQSTLLMLIAAFAGESWREAYEYALRHGFRFLSYGDACLFSRF
jgi:S-adenosylmethionine:tRNA ribosyltransferase-isomerase